MKNLIKDIEDLGYTIDTNRGALIGFTNLEVIYIYKNTEKFQSSYGIRNDKSINVFTSENGKTITATGMEIYRSAHTELNDEEYKKLLVNYSYKVYTTITNELKEIGFVSMKYEYKVDELPVLETFENDNVGNVKVRKNNDMWTATYEAAEFEDVAKITYNLSLSPDEKIFDRIYNLINIDMKLKKGTINENFEYDVNEKHYENWYDLDSDIVKAYEVAIDYNNNNR